jgi:hypothetical protein
MMPETVPESPYPLFYFKVISYLCGMETIGYVLSFIFVIFMTLGLFGAFDKDRDNPFINKK